MYWNQGLGPINMGARLNDCCLIISQYVIFIDFIIKVIQNHTQEVWKEYNFAFYKYLFRQKTIQGILIYLSFGEF